MGVLQSTNIRSAAYASASRLGMSAVSAASASNSVPIVMTSCSVLTDKAVLSSSFLHLAAVVAPAVALAVGVIVSVKVSATDFCACVCCLVATGLNFPSLCTQLKWKLCKYTLQLTCQHDNMGCEFSTELVISCQCEMVT